MGVPSLWYGRGIVIDQAEMKTMKDLATVKLTLTISVSLTKGYFLQKMLKLVWELILL